MINIEKIEISKNPVNVNEVFIIYVTATDDSTDTEFAGFTTYELMMRYGFNPIRALKITSYK